VDDIFSNRLLLASAIESMGFTHNEAANGKKAIELIQSIHFDIIFMDIEMPVMNGIETTKFIRRNLLAPLNQIPIIGLTAHNLAEFEENFDDAGFSELITKPYSVEKLISIIQKFV